MDSYNWRGLMINTARHMPSIAWLRLTVDKMGELDLNYLHLHLSDDQGFRFESKKFPKLNEISSWRAETAVGRNFPSEKTNFATFEGDGKRYGGFYTQDELRELCKYAKERGVTVVPEIDIPGHMTAILAAYPEFAENKPPTEVAKWWGVFNNIIADTPETHAFLKALFEEMCDVFDGPYIHAGGDEVPIEAYGHPEAPINILQSIVNLIQERGKTAILWEEVAPLALETKSILMNWRKLETGVRQLAKGGKVIFCPKEFFYFDYYQNDPSTEPLAIGGYLPVEIVSAFRLGRDVIKKYRDQILGIQANLWTEYMPTEERMDYMLYPRLNAFSKCKP